MSIIRAERKKRGLSQAAMAELLGCSPQLVSFMESGARKITPQKAVEWEAILRVPREKLCPEIFKRAAGRSFA